MAAISNSELCNRNGVAIYRVGEVYEFNDAGDPIPEADLRKWFVAVPADRVDSELVKSIPLSESYEEAETLAVDHFGLIKIVCPECGATVHPYSQNTRTWLSIVASVSLLLVLLGAFGSFNGLFDVDVGQQTLAVTVLAPIAIAWMIWQVIGPKKASGFFCTGCGYSE